MWRWIVFPFTPEIVTEKIKVDDMESVSPVTYTINYIIYYMAVKSILYLLKTFVIQLLKKKLRNRHKSIRLTKMEKFYKTRYP